MLKIIIPGEPTAQGRPRFTTISGHAVAYDPPKSKNYKAFVKMLGENAVKKQGWQLFDLPIEMRLKAYLSVPKSKSKKFREQALKGAERPTKKPDCSNIVKGIEDALNGVAYLDDKLIVKSVIEKWYSDSPRVEVCLQYAEI